ncbi:DUF308 domain-containing protein [Nesterenkonia sp. MY13]|uniref:DUF308 domain-containing protein n=1 Tax=Nesterenkonia sedimenti TaxID=1463632 RepID=A0A7X8TJT1_9MICC|nr:DUF308 domain-containing protein [Nesterenkonia sedimenti]NLS09874.1 DUF308 domain-containing protein [Nesterenkonia sedimenti]
MSSPTLESTTENHTSTRNALGIIALITAILGTIFACVPGALIIGWILLPIAFILSLASLFLRGKKRGAGLAGLIISIIGTVIGVIVFLAVVSNAFDEAFDDETTTDQGAESSSAESGVDEDDTAAEAESSAAAAVEEEDSENPAEDSELGTRDNPYPLGTEISSSDWTVVVNSVDFDADAAIASENQFNESPEDGHTYILVNLTATYTGDDPDGGEPWVSVSYVSPQGNSFRPSDRPVVEPDSFDRIATLFHGASETGNFALHVPAEDVENGVLSVEPEMFADTAYLAVD